MLNLLISLALIRIERKSSIQSCPRRTQNQKLSQQAGPEADEGPSAGIPRIDYFSRKSGHGPSSLPRSEATSKAFGQVVWTLFLEILFLLKM